MPTRAEWQQLLDNTTSVWTTENGVYGRRFTASNGNSIFLPATGYNWYNPAGGTSGNGFNDVGSRGYYWTSSIYTESSGRYWCFDFDSGGQWINSSTYNPDYNNGKGVYIRGAAGF